MPGPKSSKRPPNSNAPRKRPDGPAQRQFEATRGTPHLLSDACKHNLPAPRSGFVGRQNKISEVKRPIAMARLLTLTGAGGIGQDAPRHRGCPRPGGPYPDGVWLVELAPLSERGLVAQEVANALGVQERPGEPLTDTLVEALAAKAMLLVVDNCEHLVEEAARLVDTLLASCPHLKVLATSREPLGVSGEVNWAVPPLSLPDTTNGEAHRREPS